MCPPLSIDLPSHHHSCSSPVQRLHVLQPLTLRPLSSPFANAPPSDTAALILIFLVASPARSRLSPRKAPQVHRALPQSAPPTVRAMASACRRCLVSPGENACATRVGQGRGVRLPIAPQQSLQYRYFSLDASPASLGGDASGHSVAVWLTARRSNWARGVV